jgi:diguanylate cyclase (GGDEF)-like protein/PAS domain S-box-containing protein
LTPLTFGRRWWQGAIEIAIATSPDRRRFAARRPNLSAVLLLASLVVVLGAWLLDVPIVTLIALALTGIVLLRQEVVVRDNSRLHAEHARRDAEVRVRSLTGNAADAVTLVDRDGIVSDVTGVAHRVLGMDGERLIGRPIANLAHAEDRTRLASLIEDTAARSPSARPLEWRLWDGDGAWRQVETVATNMLDDPSIGQIVLTTRDVHERRVHEQRLQQAALHDVLTGLPGRPLFLDRLEHALEANSRQDRSTTVLAVNIDGFKTFNTGLGHPAGDRILREVARRITGTLGPDDTCARLGGDEFAVLLDGAVTDPEAVARARVILAAVTQPFALPETTIQLAIRIGIASEQRPGSAASLLKRALVAQTYARRSDYGGVAVFEPEMQQAIEGSLELAADLRRALDGDELLLQYQPIFDLVSGELIAAEGLVRWDHPTRGRLGPSVFVPVAEESGLIDELGAWVLRSACGEVARWARVSRARVPRVSVNLSPRQMADPNLPWEIQTTIAGAGAVPGWVALEVTEGLLMENSATVLEGLHAIRSLGISVVIDDFGTGYSSLAYLQAFPMSQIKIDRSFVSLLDDPSREPGVVRAIIEIGRALGMTTVAEGIESRVQLDRLRALGCEFGQGYLLARPLDVDAIRELVARPRPPTWAPPTSA